MHHFRRESIAGPLVQVLESLLSIDHWHRPAKICSHVSKALATNGGISDSPITSISTLEVGHKILV